MATVRRDLARTAVVDVERLRHVLASLIPLRAEAEGWSVFIPARPVAADGPTFDEAITQMVEALREYAANWQEHLLDVPSRRQNWGPVHLISLSSDEQLREWLIGPVR